MTFPGSSYAPPGVYTKSQYETPISGLLDGLRLPVLIGTGSEILSESNLTVVRGSSSYADQLIVGEDETNRAVVSVSRTGVVTLGAFDGVLNKIQVRKYPIVNGNGTGVTSTKTSDVKVTLNGEPLVVTAINGTNGILTLAASPVLGDEVRVEYYFKRTDTLIVDTVSDQVTTDGAQLYGAIASGYTISTGVNDVLSLLVDDTTTVTVTFPSSGLSTWTAAQIAAFINARAGTTTLVASTVVNNFGDTVTTLTASGNLKINNGTANSTLGYTSGQTTARNKVFYTYQGPIVDGSNGGVTTTDPTDVVVLVDGVRVVPVSVDGTTRAVTLAAAPVPGAVVTIQYYFNAWQDTFDYLAHTNITDITACGVTPGRTDFTNGVDFILKDDVIVWGTSALVSAGDHTDGSTYFNDTQVSVSLVDNKGYALPCTSVVDTSVSPPRESRKKFLLSHVPTTGNGRNSPLGSSLFQTVSNGRIDLPTDRPDLVVVYWGYGVQDALERGPVTVTAVDSATSTFTLKNAVPVGAEVFATYYYNNLIDQAYSVQVAVPGPSGVGTFSIQNEDGTTLLSPTYGTKSSGLSTITLQFPSGSERKPDVHFEVPSVTTYYDGSVIETVTVTFATTDGSLGDYTVPGSGDYEIILNASDRIRLVVDGSALASGSSGIDLGSVNGVANLGFAASMVGSEIAYDAASGYTTYNVDSTNSNVNLMVDGVVVDATAATSTTGTLASFVTALNTAAASAPPVYESSGTFLSSVVITASVYDQIRFHYTGDNSGLTGNLLSTIAAGTYASVGTLATAVEAAMATQIASLPTEFTGLDVAVTATGDGRLSFALTRPTGYAARGTVIAATVVNGNTVTISGTAFTAITGARSPGDNDFDRSGTDIATATSLVAAINDATNWSGTPPVTASNVGGTSATVTLVAASVGAAGNSITLASSGATLTVSAATLEDGADADTSGYLEFITTASAARDFSVLAGIDTAAATAGAQTKLVDGPVARRYTVVGDNTSGLLHDRLILRNRVIPGQGTVAPYHTLSYAGIEVQGGTGDVLAGLTASTSSVAGWTACVRSATLLGYVGLVGGQIDVGTYSDARDGQPAVTFYAAGGTVDQNNVFKFSMDGTPITVNFTDATGTAIATGDSAVVPLGPATSANTVLAQIRAAITAAGISTAASRVLQEGAAIRLVSASYTTASSIVVGIGNANSTLGFVDGDSSERTLVSPEILASALMAHSGASVAAVLNAWTAPSNTYFAAEALASVETDQAGAKYLYLQSQGTVGLGTTSSVAFAAASSASILLPTTGLGVAVGSGSTGEVGISGFYVTSSDPVNGSGTVNTSLFNTSDGQDGVVGQTYCDLVTGLTFTVLPREGGANYPAGDFFTFRVANTQATDSNLTFNTIPGVELLVTNTLGCAATDTAIVETFERGGEEPAVGDLYYVSYNYVKQSFATATYTKLSTIENLYGSVSSTNPVSLAAYLAFLNGAVLVGIKQVQKDTDDNGDGIADSASVTAYRNAIDDLAGSLPGNLTPNILVPLRGDSLPLFQYITKQADIESDIRHQSERTVIAGVSSGTTPKSVGSIAQAVQRTRFRLVYPDMMIVPVAQASGPDEQMLVDGTYIAAMVAGSVVNPNTDVATPWTHRELRGSLRLARTLDAVTQNNVAVSGVTVIEDLGNSVLRIRHGLTTDMVGASTNGNPVLSKLPTIIQIQDEVQQQSRATLSRFVGQKLIPGITSQIEGQLANTLKQLVQAQIIATYKDVVATVPNDDPTLIAISAAYQPIFPLLYILATFNVRTRLTT